MANSGAFKNNSLVTYIVGDSSQLTKTLKKASNDVNTYARNVKKASKETEAANATLLGGGKGGFFGRGSKGNQALRGLASGTGLGSAALFGSGPFIGAAISAGAIKASIDAASNLNEQITKSQQVFGDSDKAILKWSQDTAKNLGISQQAALEAAGTFGNLFKAQGFSTGRNSQLSRSLVQLASDLASFNNIDPAQVLGDLQSAIVGEIEPVRKYGVDLRVARVQQEALAETGKENVKQLTRQELSLARIHILFKDTASAQGDFKRTQGGLANQERILSAQIENLASNLGTLLMPAVKGTVTGINDLLGVVITATDALKSLANVKIPPIHIPFFFDFPGAGGGGALGKIASGAAKFQGIAMVSPLAAVIETIRGQLTDGAKKETKDNTRKFAADFRNIIGGFTSNAIDDALQGGGFIKLNKKIDAKGFKALLDALDLKLNKADLTSKATDNIEILRTIRTRLKEEIAAGIDVKNAKTQLVAVQKQLQEATSAKFSDVIDSLQLGVDKAQISKGLGDDVAALQAVKAGLEKQIKAGVDVQSAQHQLASVTAQIASTQQQIKQDGIDKIMGALQLGVDQAGLTKGLGDDLKALERQAAGIRAQIKAGNDVANNQSQLISVLQNIKNLREQIRQNQQDALKASAFKQIGLSATGGEIIPGIANLKKQFDQLSSQDLSGVTKKLTNRLAGVGKALTNPILKSLPEVRDAIRQLFAAIRDELNKQDIGGKNEVKALNTNKIVKGLGLDPASVKALRQRLSKFTAGGQALAGTGVAAIAGGVPVVGGVPQVFVDVSLDGEKIAKNTTIRQGKRARKNPPQKRGPQAGRI